MFTTLFCCDGALRSRRKDLPVKSPLAYIIYKLSITTSIFTSPRSTAKLVSPNRIRLKTRTSPFTPHSVAWCGTDDVHYLRVVDFVDRPWCAHCEGVFCFVPVVVLVKRVSDEATKYLSLNNHKNEERSDQTQQYYITHRFAPHGVQQYCSSLRSLAFLRT